MQNYLEAVTAVIQMMKEKDSTCKDISAHIACYTGLFKHLLAKGIPFSMDAAMDWLEGRATVLSRASYTKYRNILFRLEHYLMFGNIDTPFCVSDEYLFCRSGMSESFYRLTYELETSLNIEQNPCYYHRYSVAIKAFFRLATAHDVSEPEAISIDVILSYWEEYCLQLESLSRRQNAVCAMTALMKYLHKRGDVPACYHMVLFGENAETLKKMKLPVSGNVAHPSVPLESQVDAFWDALDEWNYKESSKALYRTDFIWYFMFLELNHLEHSSETVRSWSSVLPSYPDQKKQNSTVTARKIHTIKMFDEFLKGSMNGNVLYKRPAAADSLPEWSRLILSGFLKNRRRDGMAEKTIDMCRASGTDFFKYLEKKGILSPYDITPEIVKAYHLQNYHSTPESKNAYSTKLRQLLKYMAEEELVSETLVFAVPTTCASHRAIVDVLSDEAVEKIYEYRDKASSPLELRDTAIVMLGLRMGIRGIDIVNLKLDNFDWKNKTVSFIQRKNRKAITLPLPTDVGNSVYKYISSGRPESATSGNGYVFIRHQAPYIPFSDKTLCCREYCQMPASD